MTSPAPAEPYWLQQQAVNAAAVAIAVRMWQQSGGNPTRWAAVLAFVVATIMRAQAAAVTAAPPYIASTLVDLGIDAPPAAIIDPLPLIGVTGNGLPLSRLYADLPEQLGLHAAKAVAQQVADETGEPVPEVLPPMPAAQVRELPPQMFQDAMNKTTDQFASHVQTTISDTGRDAESLEIAARPGIGYVRMLNPPSCKRCVVLAGKFYRWNAGFKRHPNCFPAGTVVSGPRSSAASRRWYQGELVVFTTASGEDLAVTGNHPILTRRGWIPANLLIEGDEVVRSTQPQGAAALIVPGHDQVPALIEDVWGSFTVNGIHAVESSPEDFHGDGQYGQVDVVHANGALRSNRQSAILEPAGQHFFGRGIESSFKLAVQGVAMPVNSGHASHSGRTVRGSRLSATLRGGQFGRSQDPRLAATPYRHICAAQTPPNDVPGNAILAAQRVFAGTGQVGGDDHGIRQFDAARWDAPSAPFTVESRGRYASRGQQLLDRLTGQVELDRVVVSRRVDWRGHVYSVTSSEGWHTANNLIVSNCDCRHIPAPESVADDLTVDPDAYFRSLTEAEQDAAFTQAGAQAIRDGADISQVVNAGKGMRVAQVYGQWLKISTQGVTKRGRAGRAIRARGRTPETTPRLMPESIYKIATSRDDALRLLKLNGYIAETGTRIRDIDTLMSLATA